MYLFIQINVKTGINLEKVKKKKAKCRQKSIFLASQSARNLLQTLYSVMFSDQTPCLEHFDIVSQQDQTGLEFKLTEESFNKMHLSQSKILFPLCLDKTE